MTNASWRWAIERAFLHLGDGPSASRVREYATPPSERTS